MFVIIFSDRRIAIMLPVQKNTLGEFLAYRFVCCSVRMEIDPAEQVFAPPSPSILILAYFRLELAW